MGLVPYKKGDTARGEISADSFLKEATKWGMDLEIVDVYEVVNNKLLDGYRARYSLIERGLDDAAKTNERFLFHGTRQESIPQIISQGFLRQFAANKSLYGLGSYFSVICGESCKGSKLMKIPINKQGTMVPYETAVDRLEHPTMFVTFADNQALPVYLIAFIQKENKFV